MFLSIAELQQTK